MNGEIVRDCLRRVSTYFLLVLVWTSAAHARTVAVVRSPIADPVLVETVSRIRGELLAVGLSVRVVERGDAAERSQAEALVWFERSRADGDIDAAIEIVGDGPPFAADVWVVDEATRRPRVSRVSVEPGTENPSEKLAIRTIEVLRSAFLENDMDGDRQPPPPTPSAPAPTEPTPRDDLQGERTVPPFGLAAGVSALTGVDGVGPAILPMARIDLAPWPWLAVQAAIAGLGSRPLVESTAGSARLDQRYALVGARYRFRAAHHLQPFVALSAGALGTSVQGQAEPPLVEHTDDQWSFLLEASVGADLRFLDRFYASLATHVHFAEPSVAVHIVDSTVAVSGRPNLALTLTVGAWL